MIINKTPHDIHVLVQVDSFSSTDEINAVGIDRESLLAILPNDRIIPNEGTYYVTSIKNEVTVWKLHTIYPKQSSIIRVDSNTINVGDIDGIRLTKTIYGDVNLPPFKDDTYYIVSQMVKNASPRGDLLVPGEQVRSCDGRIIGCASLGI